MTSVLWHAKDLEQALACSIPQSFQGAGGVTLDTRLLKPGDIFLAIQGPCHDGHAFLNDAFKKGASLAIVTDTTSLASPWASKCVLVEDSAKALRAMAVFHRERVACQRIAITGSFGKTSCKEALKHVLGRQKKVYASWGNFNNHWGVPLSLCQMPLETEVAIFEVGMNTPGEIAPLASMIQPHMGWVTTIQAMHLERMKTVDAIVAEKTSLFQGVQKKGVGILCRESLGFEKAYERLVGSGLTPIVYGLNHPGESWQGCLQSYSFDQKGLQVKATIDQKEICFQMPVFHEPWALNGLGVLMASKAFEVDVDQAARDLYDMPMAPGRGRLIKAPMDMTFMDDGYNAGYASMVAALKALGRFPCGKGRRIAVLGDMAEMGGSTEKGHFALKETLEENGIDGVVTLGPHMKAMANTLSKNIWHLHKDQVEKKGVTFLNPGDVVLFKGSKGQRSYEGACMTLMQTWLEALEKRPRKGEKSV